MIVIYKFIATVKLNSTDTMFSYRGGRQEMTQWKIIDKSWSTKGFLLNPLNPKIKS